MHPGPWSHGRRISEPFEALSRASRETFKELSSAQMSSSLFVVKDKQHSITVALSSANEIILACVFGPSDLSTSHALECWCGTLRAALPGEPGASYIPG